MPPGSLLGPSKAVLDCLGPQKPLKLNFVVKVVADAGFRYSEIPDGPLGLILAHLGPILGSIWP